MAAARLKLPAALESFLAAQVERGVYRSRPAAIVAAVASAKRRSEQQAWLDRDPQTGINSGNAESLNMAEVIRRGRGRLATGKSPESNDRLGHRALMRCRRTTNSCDIKFTC
jgi:Arc/MetJ-type ribon-helix-helix transcriptional regulator